MNAHKYIPLGIALLLALAPASIAAPHKPKPAPPKIVTTAVPDTPAVAAVRAYVAAWQAGQADTAYALLSPATQAQFPPAQRDKVLADADLLKNMPPGLLPVLALLADVHNTLHFKFNVLGASPDDQNVALVRTYQVGTPLTTVRVLKVVTVPDPAGGTARLDGEKTMLLAAPEIAGMRAKAQQASSQSNLKQLSLGIIQYTQDHDMVMPDADKWVDELMPYVKSESLFRDPSAPAEEKWSYAFNRNLSGVRLADIASSATTVLLFETTLGTKNASDTGESVPSPGRHNNGTDYAKADGHVLWLADGAKPSFLLSGE